MSEPTFEFTQPELAALIGALIDAAARAPHHNPRLDEIVFLLRTLNEKVDTMSATTSTTAQEVATLQTNMTALHGAVTDIQSRLAAALANPAGTDNPAVTAELHAINTDLEGVVTSMAPPAVVHTPENTANTTPNSPGGRNNFFLPNFDPTAAETA